MKTQNFVVLLLTFATLFNACNNNIPSEQKVDPFEITKMQFQANSMQLGKIERIVVEDIVKCTGNVVPQANSVFIITSSIKGFIKNIFIENGQFINKDQLLIEIAGNDLIDLQKEFAIVSANFKKTKLDYERNSLLYKEKAISDKDFTAIESEFKSISANYNALKLKIEMLGLSPEKIENGNFYPSYFIKSPIDGYVNNINSQIGANVENQDVLLDIINTNFKQLKLAVFPSDISKVKIGQTVKFRQVKTEELFTAEISAIGYTIDEETKAFYCYAKIPSNNKNLYFNMFVEASIITNLDTITAIPKSAVFKSSENYYILKLSKIQNDKYYFVKQKVNIGMEYNDYFHVLDDNLIEEQILLNGGYFLFE